MIYYNQEWHLIRRVYTILLFKLLLIVGVASAVIFLRPVHPFLSFFKTTTGIIVRVLLFVVALILLWPLCRWRRKRPVNFLLLGLFTAILAVSVGLTCAHSWGKVILEAAILSAGVAAWVSLYALWAVKSDWEDFKFFRPFLSSALLVIVSFGIIQWFFPFDKLSRAIYGGVGVIIFSAYIICSTVSLIGRYVYADYVWASVELYLNIVNLFSCIYKVLGRCLNDY